MKKKLGFNSKKLLTAILGAALLFVYPSSVLDIGAHAATKVTLSGWQLQGGKWYFYQNGTKKTGWLLDHHKWYYLDKTGVMKTGWVQDQGKWYYLDSHGVMQTGWIKDQGKWYYMDANGAMHTGWLSLNGKTYYLMSNGAAAVGGWKSIGSYRYYFDRSGAVETGWKSLSGSWYYFSPSDGAMEANNFEEGYYLLSDGKMSTAGNAGVVSIVDSLKKSIDVGVTQADLKNLLGSAYAASADSEGNPYWMYYLKAGSGGSYQAVKASIDDNPYDKLGSGLADILVQTYWDQAGKAFTVHIQYFDANHKFHDYLSTKYDYVYN